MANGQQEGWALVYPPEAHMVGIGDVDADEPFEFADGLQIAARGQVQPQVGITVLRVVGHILLQADPSWWTTAGLTDVKFRIQCLDYSHVTMAAQVPTGWDISARRYAGEPFMWYHNLRTVETTNGGYFTIPVDVRVKRRLEEGQTIYLLTRNDSGTGHTVQAYFRLRTLCKIGGRQRP